MNTTAISIAARLESALARPREWQVGILRKVGVDGVAPSLVARPASSAEVVEIGTFAKSEKLALIPCGRRDKTGIGMPPARYDIALTWERD